MPAFQDQPTRRDDAELSLSVAQRRNLFDPVKGMLGRLAEDGKDAAVLQEIDGVILPVTLADHLPIDIEDKGEFRPVKADLAGSLERIADTHNRRHGFVIAGQMRL